LRHAGDPLPRGHLNKNKSAGLAGVLVSDDLQALDVSKRGEYGKLSKELLSIKLPDLQRLHRRKLKDAFS
jgi:hypothetical protein